MPSPSSTNPCQWSGINTHASNLLFRQSDNPVISLAASEAIGHARKCGCLLAVVNVNR